LAQTDDPLPNLSQTSSNWEIVSEGSDLRPLPDLKQGRLRWFSIYIQVFGGYDTAGD
jgi:hypothetical protein